MPGIRKIFDYVLLNIEKNNLMIRGKNDGTLLGKESKEIAEEIVGNALPARKFPEAKGMRCRHSLIGLDFQSKWRK